MMFFQLGLFLFFIRKNFLLPGFLQFSKGFFADCKEIMIFEVNEIRTTASSKHSSGIDYAPMITAF